jgi:pimeloyl-ACP methyl ester carboxylesterase
MGEDPGGRLEVRSEDSATMGAGPRCDGIEEIWHLSYAISNGDGAGADFLAGFARETGAAYRRFDLDPLGEAPDEVAPGAFSRLMHTLHATVQEVRSRDPSYFEHRALRTTLRADLAFLDAESAASEVLSAASGLPGRSRISVAKPESSLLSDAIGDAYDLELIMGAEPSSLAAVDRLFESRLGNLASAWSTDPDRHGRSVSSSELANLMSAWRRYHDASSHAERARLRVLSGATRPAGAEGGGPAIQVFGESGPVIIIVNAIAQDLRYWIRLIDRLARDHRIVTWMQQSSREDGQPATFDDHLGDLETIVNEVTDGPVHLVGWCTGPKLCVRYCLAHSRRVASMVFLAGTYRPFGDGRFDTRYEITLEMVFKLLDHSPNAAATVRATLLDAMSMQQSKAAPGRDLGTEVLARIDPALVSSVAAPYATDESTLLYAKQIRDFWSRSIVSDVGVLDTPTLVIGAELDQIASPLLGLRVSEAMPCARYVELPGATHYCMYDRPDEVASILGRFIKERHTNSSSSLVVPTP